MATGYIYLHAFGGIIGTLVHMVHCIQQLPLNLWYNIVHEAYHVQIQIVRSLLMAFEYIEASMILQYNYG